VHLPGRNRRNYTGKQKKPVHFCTGFSLSLNFPGLKIGKWESDEIHRIILGKKNHIALVRAILIVIGFIVGSYVP
jgi:hypothetical protein